uniref:Uncharacterized protein n=1 Tax=Anguilla anguilla TaxID=7936 RepID=A0A0E9RLE5_ANGAN
MGSNPLFSYSPARHERMPIQLVHILKGTFGTDLPLTTTF